MAKNEITKSDLKLRGNRSNVELLGIPYTISRPRKELFDLCERQNNIRVEDLEFRPDVFQNNAMMANGQVKEVLEK